MLSSTKTAMKPETSEPASRKGTASMKMPRKMVTKVWKRCAMKGHPAPDVNVSLKIAATPSIATINVSAARKKRLRLGGRVTVAGGGNSDGGAGVAGRSEIMPPLYEIRW